MQKNYYSILSVPRDASVQQIQSAYRLKAIQYHPQQTKPSLSPSSSKQQTNNQQAFEEVAEALQVLSDAKLRALYDQYGEQGLNNTIDGQAGGNRVWRPTKTGVQTFLEFFGTPNSFEADVKTIFTNNSTVTLKHQPPVEHNLYCSLEELYAGCVKHEKVLRQQYNGNADTTSMEEVVFSVTVQAGWKAGTRVTFAKQGDQSPQSEPADLVFVIQEKPHPRFRRQGNNLLYTASISLRAALTGSIFELESIDGRTLVVGLPQIINPGSRKVVVGEGMPTKQHNKRGNLIIDFSIQFPSELSADAQNKLKTILPL